MTRSPWRHLVLACGLAAVGSLVLAASWLDLLVSDEEGATWSISEVTERIELGGDGSRLLTLEARPEVEGVASLVFTVDGVRRSTVNLGEAEPREFVSTVERSEDDVEEFVAASTADASRWPAGFTYLTSSDLELGTDPSHGRQLVAVRFPGLDVASAAEITAAEVRFTAQGTSSGPLTLRVRGVLAPAPLDLAEDAEGSGSGLLSDATLTTASITWDVETTWRDDDVVSTPDLTPLVEEVLAGAADGEIEVTFVFEHLEGDGFRRAHALDGPGGPPSLHLAVVEPASSGPVALQVPNGTSTISVIGYAEPGGRGAVVGSVELEVVAVAQGEPAAGAEGGEAGADPNAAPAPESEDQDPAVDAAPGPEVEPDSAAEPESDPQAETEAPESETDWEPRSAPEPDPSPSGQAPEPDVTAEPEATPPPGANATPVPAPAPDPEPATPPTPLPTPEATPAPQPAMPVVPPVLRLVELVPRGDVASLVTVVLTEPAQAPVRPLLVAGTCDVRGDTILGLKAVATGESGSTTTIRVSATALRLGGFVVVLDGVTDACLPLTR